MCRGIFSLTGLYFHTVDTEDFQARAETVSGKKETTSVFVSSGKSCLGVFPHGKTHRLIGVDASWS